MAFMIDALLQSARAGSRHFGAGDVVRKADLQSDPLRPQVWLQYCLQLARSDGATIAAVLDALSAAVAHNRRTPPSVLLNWRFRASVCCSLFRLTYKLFAVSFYLETFRSFV
jgi:hypothetical protein